MMEPNPHLEVVIAGLTRNLPSDRDTLQRRRWRMFLRHDGKRLGVCPLGFITKVSQK